MGLSLPLINCLFYFLPQILAITSCKKPLSRFYTPKKLLAWRFGYTAIKALHFCFTSMLSFIFCYVVFSTSCLLSFSYSTIYNISSFRFSIVFPAEERRKSNKDGIGGQEDSQHWLERAEQITLGGFLYNQGIARIQPEYITHQY